MYEQPSPPSSWRGISGVLALAVLIGALSGAFAGASVALLIPRGGAETKPAADVSPPTTTNLVQVKEESAITETFQKVSPGVVTLIV